MASAPRTYGSGLQKGVILVHFQAGRIMQELPGMAPNWCLASRPNRSTVPCHYQGETSDPHHLPLCRALGVANFSLDRIPEPFQRRIATWVPLKYLFMGWFAGVSMVYFFHLCHSCCHIWKVGAADGCFLSKALRAAQRSLFHFPWVKPKGKEEGGPRAFFHQEHCRADPISSFPGNAVDYNKKAITQYFATKILAGKTHGAVSQGGSLRV